MKITIGKFKPIKADNIEEAIKIFLTQVGLKPNFLPNINRVKALYTIKIEEDDPI